MPAPVRNAAFAAMEISALARLHPGRFHPGLGHGVDDGPGSNDGVVFGGVRLTPMKGLRIDLSDDYAINTFNTLFLDGEYLWQLNSDWKFRFGAQFTDQRAVGKALVRNAASTYWSTQNGGMRVQAIYRDLVLTGAFSVTGSGNNIQTPPTTRPRRLPRVSAASSTSPGAGMPSIHPRGRRPPTRRSTTLPSTIVRPSK